MRNANFGKATLAAVRAKMSLTVLAYNLKGVLNIVSFAALMKAVQSPA
jgi:hypothetical protein